MSSWELRMDLNGEGIIYSDQEPISIPDRTEPQQPAHSDAFPASAKPREINTLSKIINTQIIKKCKDVAKIKIDSLLYEYLILCAIFQSHSPKIIK